ncbi:MAG: DUF1761 domain-containing protein [Spirochaetales bacterium]|nr:DUF1761 domain-containing protein [Spirochaetales bacterium]
MNLDISYFNIWAILLTIVLQMVLGALWYSPAMFGKIWLELTNQKQEDISREEGNKAMAFAVIPAIFSSIFLAIILALTGASTILEGVIIGSILSIGFGGMAMLNLVFFEGRSFRLTLLNAGYAFTGMNLGAIILIVWN